MINIFVIEYFGERDDRKHFWEELSHKYEESPSVRISICPQNKSSGYLRNTDGTPYSFESYDLVFVHDSDKDYTETDSYIDFAGIIPIVCYSGGATYTDISKLSKCQIKVLPIDTLKKNADKFFRHIAAEGGLTSDAFNDLAGFDPRRAAAIKLLRKFLPLDVELQLGDVSKCREQAESLIKEDIGDFFLALLDQIYSKKAAPSSPDTVANYELSVKLKDRLITLARTVAVGGTSSFDILFGYQVDETGSVNRHDSSKLQEAGFHRTFERLRDNLLDEKN